MSRSRVRNLFTRELFFVDHRSGDALIRVKFINFSDGRFDCTPSELDEAVYSKDVEWLWFVWDRYDSITDPIREAMSNSSLERIHREHVCQIETADKTSAENDLERLISKGWEELPLALNIETTRTVP